MWKILDWKDKTIAEGNIKEIAKTFRELEDIDLCEYSFSELAREVLQRSPSYGERYIYFTIRYERFGYAEYCLIYRKDN